MALDVVALREIRMTNPPYRSASTDSDPLPGDAGRRVLVPMVESGGDSMTSANTVHWNGVDRRPFGGSVERRRFDV